MTAQHVQPILENREIPLKIPVSRPYSNEKQPILRFIQEEIATLKENWDGYAASPIEKKVLINLTYLVNNLPINWVNDLDKDAILPNPNGTISLEWRNNANELCLEIGNDYSTYYLKVKEKIAKINNHFIISNDLEFSQFVKDLNLI
jgi:hypothetical protein